MGKIAKTFRLGPDLVASYEAEAKRRGQTFTVFVERALEQSVAERDSRGPAPLRRPRDDAHEAVMTSEAVSKGLEKAAAPARCRTCKGTGRIEGRERCKSCGGSGKP